MVIVITIFDIAVITTAAATTTTTNRDNDATGSSMTLSTTEHNTSAAETEQQACVCDNEASLPVHSDAAAAAAVPTSSSSSSSLTHVEGNMAVSDKPDISVSCGQSSTDMKPSSVDETVSTVNVDQSAMDLKQSSPDSAASNEMNSCQSVSDIADELSVVIPSSCDSVSDDERYLSGQCTLMELLTETSAPSSLNTTDSVSANVSTAGSPRTRLGGCSTVGNDILLGGKENYK